MVNLFESFERELRKLNNGLIYKVDDEEGLIKVAMGVKVNDREFALCFSNVSIFYLESSDIGLFTLEDIKSLDSFIDEEPEYYEEYEAVIVIDEEENIWVDLEPFEGYNLSEGLVNSWFNLVTMGT